MMYTMSTILLLLFSVIAVSISATSFEDLDIERLLGNEERTKSVFACLMDKQPCGEFQGLRDTIPELIKTKCNQCSLKEKKKYDHVSKVLLERNPDIFNALVLKYSPHGTRQ